MQIRQEQPQDKSRIATLIARTYGVEGAHVIELTGKLREEMQQHKGLAYVCEGEAEVNAYALFTPVEVNGKKDQALLLAPFALDPSDEKLNARDFITEAVGKAKEEGFRYIVLLGMVDELTGRDFKSAQELGIKTAEGTDPSQVFIKDFGGSEALEQLGLPDCLK